MVDYDAAKKIVYGEEFPHDMIRLRAPLNKIDFTVPRGTLHMVLGGPSGREIVGDNNQQRFVVKDWYLEKELVA